MGEGARRAGEGLRVDYPAGSLLLNLLLLLLSSPRRTKSKSKGSKATAKKVIYSASASALRGRNSGVTLPEKG